MATLAEAVEAIGTTLRAAGFDRVEPFMADDVSPPTAVVSVFDGDVESMALGTASYRVRVTLVEQAVAVRSGVSNVYAKADLTATGGVSRALFGEDLGLTGVRVGSVRLVETGSVTSADGRRFAAATLEFPLLISGST